MWLPKKFFDLFSSAQVETSTLRVERDLLIRELAEVKANFKWMTVRVNALEQERAVLLNKVYNIQVASPVIVQQPNTVPDFNESIFTDLDELADAKKQVADVLPKWSN